MKAFYYPLPLILIPVLGAFASISDILLLHDINIQRLADQVSNDEQLARVMHHRKLQSTCELLENGAKQLFAQGGIGLSCSCTSSYNTYELTCTTNKPECCGNICGYFKAAMEFSDASGRVTPVTESSCVEYTSGINGTRCASASYCSSGTSICSCSVSLNDSPCQTCSPCKDSDDPIPGLVFLTYDCTNVPGGEQLLNYECKDVSDLLKIQCAAPDLYMRGFTILSLGVVTAILFFI
jgi:hypothetical protein